MVGSFRRRLLAIAALTVLVCVSAITATLLLSRMTAEDKIERARESVAREVERLQGALAGVPSAQRPRRQRQTGELRSGYVTGPGEVDEGGFVVEAVRRAARDGDLVVLDREDWETTPVLVAATPVAGGGYVFAFERVVAGRQTRGLRAVVLVLALLTFGLVVASLRTLTAVERGVSSLRASLAALGTDLRAPIGRPKLRELDEVASGVAALVQELDGAQRERERLTHQLLERERFASLGRVAAGIAHEVRNPLTAMKLRADLARTGGEATPSIARDLDDIASEIARLDRLVSDLLVVSGRRSGPRAEVDVGELVARRVALLAPWAAEKGVEVTSKGTARACIDADAISRAVDNVLRNAVEASPQGARVEVNVQAQDGEARIAVVDHGEGVPPSRAAELFEPFFTTKPSGTGLGLALARAVANAHDGTLSYAREGDVTSFALTMCVLFATPAARAADGVG